MAHSKQARKRVRQNETRRMANKTVSSSMRSAVKKLQGLVEAGDTAAAQAELSATLSKIDKAAKKNVIHANAAARKKSQMMRAVNGAAK